MRERVDKMKYVIELMITFFCIEICIQISGLIINIPRHVIECWSLKIIENRYRQSNVNKRCVLIGSSVMSSTFNIYERRYGLPLYCH